MEEVARNPAAFADMVFSGVRRAAGLKPRRTVSRTTVDALFKAGAEGATKGMREAWEIIKRGDDPEELDKIFQLREVQTGNPVLNAYINLPFRFQGAQDRVFRTFAFRRAVEDMGRVIAINQGYKGSALKARTAEIGKEVLDGSSPGGQAVALEAVARAEYAVFQNQNLVAQAVGAVKEQLRELPGGGVASFVIDRVIPFPKTPTNVLLRALDYSGLTGPFRAGAAVGRTLKEAKRLRGLKDPNKVKGVRGLIDAVSKRDQRNISLMLGRGMVGQGIIYLGVKLGAADKLTGFFSDDRGEQGLDTASGRKPGSLRVGDEWVEVAGVSPIGNLLALGATMARESKDKDGFGLGDAASLGFDFATQQPLAQASRDVGAAVASPESKLPRLAGSIAAQTVPTWMAELAAVRDEVERDVSPEGAALIDRIGDSILKGIKKRVPGLREKLPVKTDALGEPVGRALYSSTARSTKITDELRRQQVGIAAGKSASSGKLVKERLSALIASPAYGALDGRLKKQMLGKVIEDARADYNESKKGRALPEKDMAATDIELMIVREQVLSELERDPQFQRMSDYEKERVKAAVRQRMTRRRR
jgi:hypothetical protein